MQTINFGTAKYTHLGALILASAFSGFSSVHTGDHIPPPHASISAIVQGLTHPLAADHLIAMLVVGAWSVIALPAKKIAGGPVCFLIALLCGALVGVFAPQVSIALPNLEQMIAMSLVLLGGLIWLAYAKFSSRLGLGLIAGAGLLHGLAHGLEAPFANGYQYVVGFLITTTCLHFAGIVMSLLSQRAFGAPARTMFKGIGLAVAGFGLWLQF
jgi:urease accessory protein